MCHALVCSAVTSCETLTELANDVSIANVRGGRPLPLPRHVGGGQVTLPPLGFVVAEFSELPTTSLIVRPFKNTYRLVLYIELE